MRRNLLVFLTLSLGVMIVRCEEISAWDFFVNYLANSDGVTFSYSKSSKNDKNDTSVSGSFHIKAGETTSPNTTILRSYSSNGYKTVFQRADETQTQRIYCTYEKRAMVFTGIGNIRRKVRQHDNNGNEFTCNMEFTPERPAQAGTYSVTILSNDGSTVRCSFGAPWMFKQLPMTSYDNKMPQGYSPKDRMALVSPDPEGIGTTATLNLRQTMAYDEFGMWQWNDDKTKIYVEPVNGPGPRLIIWNIDGDLTLSFETNKGNYPQTNTISNNDACDLTIWTKDNEEPIMLRLFEVNGEEVNPIIRDNYDNDLFSLVSFNRFTGAFNNPSRPVINQLASQRDIIVRYQTLKNEPRTYVYHLEGLDTILEYL